MRLAVLSDIHSNHYSLEACLRWIDSNKIDGLVFLGDYVSDCPCPQKTMELLKIAREKYPTWFVMGNRDELMVDRRLEKFQWKESQGSLKYTYDNLTDEDIDFFASLPATMEIEIEGYPMFSVSHGGFHKKRVDVLPESDELHCLMEEMKGTLHLCGHTHKSFIYEKDGKTVANPGSVGVPLGGCAKAEMAVLESDGSEWKITLHRIDYDIESAIEEFFTSGLAEKAGVWGRCVMAQLRTGRHYSEELFALIRQYVEETGKAFDDDELWERAADKLEI